MTALETALDELERALTEFVALLEREDAALRGGYTDELAAIVVEKTVWSNTASTAWNRLVVVSGIDVRRGESLEATMATLPLLQPKWRDVRQLAERAERLNRGNNTLIEAQLQRTRMALDVLQSAASGGALYGANGRMVDGPASGHTLDKA